MGSNIRLGQLIAPFGPGSIYTDKNGVPTVVCGLDYWYKIQDEFGKFKNASDAIKISTIFEPRLSDLLKVSHFRSPPEYLFDRDRPELSGLKVPGHRFPRWYVNNATGVLRKFNLTTQRLERSNKGAWRPVRFIAVCQAGHMTDFPWKAWSKCTCNNEAGLILNDSGGPDLSSITVKCTNCKQSNTLSGATVINRNETDGTIESTGLSKAGIFCNAERPWLGESGGESNCEMPHSLAAVLINQSNIYFTRTVSAIFLPDTSTNDEDCRNIQEVLSDDSLTTMLKIYQGLGEMERFYGDIRSKLKNNYGYTEGNLPRDKVILTAFETYGRGGVVRTSMQPKFPESKNSSFRREEYNILRNEVPDGASSELRILPADISTALKEYFSRVNLVEKLRETRVFFGFDRLQRSRDPFEEMPASALNQLFLKQSENYEAWLPAVKNYGEGIYIELNEDTIGRWQENNSSWLRKRYKEDFIGRMTQEPMLLPPSSGRDWVWASRYQLVHTLSHILINQMVFECGYSSAALKERLFISSDPSAPMAGILIYTASGDSEGSLGGLVRLGRPELFESTVRKAVSRASWCSADPVCSENHGGSGSRLLNMAACHACALLPETACETINSGLDRAAVTGIPENQESGYLSNFIAGYDI